MMNTDVICGCCDITKDHTYEQKWLRIASLLCAILNATTSGGGSDSFRTEACLTYTVEGEDPVQYTHITITNLETSAVTEYDVDIEGNVIVIPEDATVEPCAIEPTGGCCDEEIELLTTITGDTNSIVPEVQQIAIDISSAFSPLLLDQATSDIKAMALNPGSNLVLTPIAGMSIRIHSITLGTISEGDTGLITILRNAVPLYYIPQSQLSIWQRAPFKPIQLPVDEVLNIVSTLGEAYCSVEYSFV